MTKSMTEGKPLKLILAFAVPMFLGMLFQQFYSMVDTIIVGKFLGVEPLAGVGSTSSINFMVIGFCNGICNGFAVPIAQMFGAKQESELRRFVANAAWLCIGFAIGITILVVGLCRPILELMNTPENIFRYAYVYIVIIFWGIPCTILYNFLAAVIRSLGDSKSPVVFLALASVINIVLDIVFILVLHMNVEGPALATVISQGISGLVCLVYAVRKYPILRMTKEEMRPRKHHLWKLCYLGLPMGLQYSITAIGSIVVQTAVNGFGAVAVAGVTAAQKINGFIACPFEALGATMASYSGQNMGAGRMDRITEGLKAAILCGFAASVVLLAGVMLGGRELALLFLDKPDKQVLRYAYQAMVTAASGYCFLTLVNTVRFTIQGMGYSVFAVTAGVMETAARLLAGVVLVKFMGFTAICMAHVLAWIFADLFLIPAFFHCKRKAEKMHGMDKKEKQQSWNGKLQIS